MRVYIGIEFDDLWVEDRYLVLDRCENLSGFAQMTYGKMVNKIIVFQIRVDYKSG